MDVGKCLVCRGTFNSTSRRPKLLDCGHIICLQDLERMVKGGSVRCPSDQQESKKGLGEFVDDHSQIDLIDSFEVRCKTHKTVVEHFCLRDCVPVCESCISEHRSCEMRALPDDHREISMRVTQEIETLNKQFGGQVSANTKAQLSRLHSKLLREQMEILYEFRECQLKCTAHQSTADQFCLTHMLALCKQCSDMCPKKRLPDDFQEVCRLIVREVEALMATATQPVSPDLRGKYERRVSLPLQECAALVLTLRKLQPRETLKCSMCPAEADGFLRLTDFKAFCAEHGQKNMLDASSSLPLKDADEDTVCQRIIDAFPKFLQKVDCYNLSLDQLMLISNPPRNLKALHELGIALIRKMSAEKGSLDQAPDDFHCPECMKPLRRATAVLTVLPCRLAFHALCDSCVREKAQEPRAICPLDKSVFGVSLDKFPQTSLSSSPPVPLPSPSVPQSAAPMVPPELQAAGIKGVGIPQQFAAGGLPGFPPQPPAFQSFSGQSPQQGGHYAGFQTMPPPGLPQGFPPGLGQPGMPQPGFPQGYGPPGVQGFPQGLPPGFPQGYGQPGVPQPGFPQGFPPGYGPPGVPQPGFPQGFPPGFAQPGMPSQPPIGYVQPAVPPQYGPTPTVQPAQKPVQPATKVPAPQPPAPKPVSSTASPQNSQTPISPSVSIPKVAGTSLPPARFQPPDYALDRFPSVLPPINVPAAQRVPNQRGWSQTSGRNQVEAVIFTCSEEVKLLGVSIATPVERGQTSIVEFVNVYRGKDTRQRPMYSHANRERIEGGNLLLTDIRFAQPVPIAPCAPYSLKIKLVGAPDVGYETYRGNPFDRPDIWFGEDGSLWEFEECTLVESGEYLNGQNNLSGPILRFLYRH